MKQPPPAGKCTICDRTLSKAAMAGHLETCRKPRATHLPEGDREKSNLHLLVEGHDAPEYWLHLSAPAHLSLKQLDGYLRRTWLECCGHLSAFEIDGERYESLVEGTQEKDMRAALGSILRVGCVFGHEYDFGSTTELILTVLGLRQPDVERRGVQLLARNERPVINCKKCGSLATSVCPYCLYEGKGWLCYECSKKHQCGEAVMLPVVNSPRTGVCGYIGYY